MDADDAQPQEHEPVEEEDTAASHVIAASAWEQFERQHYSSSSSSSASAPHASHHPPPKPTLLRKPARTFTVHQTKMLYQPETSISKYLDPYLGTLWADDYVQQARFCSTILFNPASTPKDMAQASVLRSEFPAHIAFLQTYLINHYVKLMDTRPLALALAEIDKWDDPSKAPLLTQGCPDTPYGRLELLDAKAERAKIIARARQRLEDAATANARSFDPNEFNDEDLIDMEREVTTVESTVKSNPLSQLNAMKSQPLIVSNRASLARAYTCDLISTLMYAIAHMEAVLMRGELEMYHLERELKLNAIDPATAPESPLHATWLTQLGSMIHNAADFEHKPNLDRFYEALLRFKTEMVYTIVWDQICALQTIYTRLHAATRVYTWYFLQHELLSKAVVTPCPVVPVRWRRKLNDYMCEICSRDRDFGFEQKFQELVYDHELKGNECYRYVIENEQADLDMQSREIIIASWPEKELRALYNEIKRDKITILNEVQNPLRLHLMVTIFEECFIQSMQKFSFLQYYFITNRQLFERHGMLKRMARTDVPYVERRPVIVCLLGKWVVWKGTGVIYQSDDMSELLLTWLYLLDQEYDGVLDIRGTSASGVMRTIGIGRLPRPSAWRLEGEEKKEEKVEVEEDGDVSSIPLTDLD